jgi:hypothetical protein
MKLANAIEEFVIFKQSLGARYKGRSRGNQWMGQEVRGLGYLLPVRTGARSPPALCNAAPASSKTARFYPLHILHR